MALQKDIMFKGVSIQNGYIRVSNANVTKTQISYVLSYCANAQSDPLQAIEHTCEHNLLGGNAIKQAYEHAKTLPDMVGATDV